MVKISGSVGYFSYYPVLAIAYLFFLILAGCMSPAKRHTVLDASKEGAAAEDRGHLSTAPGERGALSCPIPPAGVAVGQLPCRGLGMHHPFWWRAFLLLVTPPVVDDALKAKESCDVPNFSGQRSCAFGATSCSVVITKPKMTRGNSVLPVTEHLGQVSSQDAEILCLLVGHFWFCLLESGKSGGSFPAVSGL